MKGILSLVKQSVRPAVEFLSRLRAGQSLSIIHDDDPDGICSAVLLSKVCERVASEKPRVYTTEFGQSLTRKLLAQLRRQQPQAILFTDVPAIPKDLLAGVSEIGEVLVLDHHFPEPYSGVTYANPRLIDASAYLPSSYLAFQVARSLGLSRDLCWIAGIGVLADHGVRNCLPLMRLIKSRYPELIDGSRIVDEELMDASKLGELTKMFASSTIASPRSGASTAFRALDGAESYSEILDGVGDDARRLWEWHLTVEREFAKVLKDARTNTAHLGAHVVLYRFSSRLRIKSLVANYLPRLYKKEIVLVIQGDTGYTHVSLRRGERNHRDLRELVQAAVAEIPGASGGGHPEASAARIPSAKLDVFLARLLELSGRGRAN